MGAVLRKSFCFVFLFFVISLFGFAGCGDIYKNMKIVVDAESSITLYLNSTEAQSLEVQENEKEPYFKELSVTIEGAKDKNISKNLEVVFDNPKIASAGDFEYDGNNAKIKIYAAFPGTTTMYIKSSDNTAISSEGIEINVIEPISQIIVDDVKCAVSKGSTIDLREIAGIKVLPITSNDESLNFCFKDGRDVNLSCGVIKDGHILTVYSHNEVSLGPVEIVAKSSRDSVEPKTFSIIIYNNFETADIKVKNGTEELTCYETTEEVIEEANDLVIISNFVEGSFESVQRVLTLSVGADNNYEYEILNEDASPQGVVSVDKTFDENGKAKLGEFLITPIKEGVTYLKVRTYLVYGGVRYLEKDVYIKVEIKTIVKSAFIKAQTFTEIEQSDEIFEFSINDETESKLNLDIFESSKYKGTVFDVVEINPTYVLSNKFRLILDSGVDKNSGAISVDSFKEYITVYIEDSKASFSTFDNETNSYFGTEFDIKKKIYISYSDDLLEDDAVKNLSSFGMKILFNYGDGLVPFEIDVNCNVFQSVLNLKLSEESEKDVILERNKLCTLTLTAETNVNLNLFQITSNNENSVEIIKVFQSEENLKSIFIQFQTIEVGTAAISLVEKSTLKVVSININVVNINDENLTYLEIEKQIEIGKIEYDYIRASVFNGELTYYRKLNDNTYSEVAGAEVNEENYNSFYVRNTDGFVVYIQSGAQFNATLKTSKNATVSITYNVLDNEEVSYKNLVNKNIKYDSKQKILTFATSSVNEVEDIDDESTFEQIVVDVKYYVYNEDKIEEKHKNITIKVATYVKIGGFGENLSNKNFEIFDNSYLSAYNQESGIGTQSFVPTITKRTQSGLKYELKYALTFNGEEASLAEALEKGWIVEEIKEKEELVGLKIKPQTSDEILQLEILTVMFSVNEFDTVYPVWFNVECVKPTLMQDFNLNVTEINIEDFSNSNYSSAKIEMAGFSPSNVFDKNLTFIVYTRLNTTVNCLAVYDEVFDGMIERFNQNSPLTFEKHNGVLSVKYNNESISTDVNYYIKVLPSYLVNETNKTEEYYKNILENAALMKTISVNFVYGTEDNPYQIRNQNDLEKMFLSGKQNSYFVLMNDITLQNWNGENNLQNNLISNPYSKVLNVTGENYKNYYTKTLNYVHGAEYDEDETYYSYSSITEAYTVCAEGEVTENNFSNYFVLEYYKKVEDGDSFNNNISYYSKNGKYSINGLNTNFINEIMAGVRVKNINFYYDGFEYDLTSNFGLIACINHGIIENVMISPKYLNDLIELTYYNSQNISVGGLIGQNSGKIKNCYGSINLKLTLSESVNNINVGGFVGQNSGKISTEASLITLYKSNITIEGFGTWEGTKIGGLVGQNSGVIAGKLKTDNSNIIGTSIEVQANINAINCDNVGGICGESYGGIQNVSVAPQIKAKNYVGGAVGKQNGNLTYVLCEFYNNGLDEKTSIYASDYVGGLVGQMTGQITNCYVTSYYQNYELVLYGESLQGGSKFYGDICAQNYVGGLVGYANNTEILKSFANVSVGLNKIFERATSYDENQTYYSYNAEVGSYDVVAGVNSENVTEYYIITNTAGGFVGCLSDNLNNSISNSYAIVNMTNISNNIGQFIGQFDYSGNDNGFVIYCYSVFNGGNISGVPFANMIGNKNYCSNCYYQDNSVIESTNYSAYINARNSAEMQVMNSAVSQYSYVNWGVADWKVIEGVNNKYPIIVIDNLNFYNTSIGQIVIDEFLSDENEEENPLPKYVKYDEGKIVVFLDQLTDSNFSLKLSDLISLESINNYAELELKTDNTSVSFEIGNENSLDRFVLHFSGTGLAKITISSRKNTAILNTFQIFVVGGFKSFDLPEIIYVQKGGVNTAYVSFNTNSSQSYDDSLGLKLTTESVSLIDVNHISWNGNELYYYFNQSNSIIFYGNLNVDEQTLITAVPFVVVSFYNDSNQKINSVLLLNNAISAQIEPKTITAKVYEGVVNIDLNEIKTKTENRLKLEIVLSVESDNIAEFDVEDLEIYQYRIKEDVTSENYVGLFVRNSDGSYLEILESDVFDETKTYYELVKWNVNKAQNCLEHDGETINYISQIIEKEATEEKKYDIFEMKFYIEHKPYQRMTQEEIEDWFVLVENKDGTTKEDSLSISWIPSEAHSLDIIHFLNLTTYLDDYKELGFEDGTDKIASGSFGMLKISVTESFADFDYIKIEGYSNSQTMSFDRYIINDEGKLVFDYNNADYSQHIGNSLIVFNDSKANGVFYVSTLTSVSLPSNTEFTVVVSIYKNGNPSPVLTATKDLYTIFAPWVKMEIVEDYAKLTDGVVLAKGTKLNLNIFGVLQDSYVDVSLDGGEGIYLNTEGTILGDNGMLASTQTNPNYFETISIYAGVDAAITSVNGYMTLTATVNSKNVITYYVLKLYLVDYLIESLNVENVDYSYYILDGEEYIKATKYVANKTYYTRSGTEGSYSYTLASGVSSESFKPTYTINIQEGYKPLRLIFTTQFGEFDANSETSNNIEKARSLANSFGAEFDEYAYAQITKKMIDKIKELNAYGTQAHSQNGTIWTYSGTNLILGTYSYFFLMVDNDALSIRGRAEVEILLSANLHKGYKLSGDGTSYELLLQKDSITEDFLQISSGDYFSDFAIQFVNDSEEELPIPVGTVDELRDMQENGHYILTSNLELNDWVPLTTNIGSLDGNGYKLTINSFNVSENVTNIGLFETISTYQSSVTNRTELTRLTNIVIEINQDMIIDLGDKTSANFGFLAGQNNGGIIYNCEVISNKDLTIAESADYSEYGDDVQAILESTQNTTKIFIKSQASSAGGINIGGLAGTNSGFITNSRFGRLENVVTTENKGRNDVDTNNDGVVDNLIGICGFTIIGVGKMGGLTSNNSGIISASYFKNSDLINTSFVTSADDSNILTGGLVAINSGKINTSFVESEKQDIEAGTNGVLDEVEYIDGNFVRRNKNKIYSGASVGGFVNTNNGTIENCYANIYLDSVFVGGFVYKNSENATIKYSYSTCAIKDEKSNNGVFVGIDGERNINNYGTINSCYYLIDNAVSESLVDPAVGLDRTILCVQKEKILGFVFGDDNRGIWRLKLDDELGINNNLFEAPSLIEANNIAYSRREVLFDEADNVLVYNNTNFGVKENPRIVYNPSSFSNISITDSSEKGSSSYTRIVSDVNFNQNMSTINGVDSTTLKFMGNMQGNGMTFNNIKIIVETTQQEESESVKYLGFFAEIENAVISNLTLDIIAFNATMTDVVGGLCGHLINSYINTITVSSSSSASIVGAHIVGGIVGYAEGEFSNMSNLTSSISVEASYDVPINDSISLWNGKITNKADVEKQSYAGGIAGVVNLGEYVKAYDEPKVVNCEVLGNFLIKAEIVGGLFGCVSGSTAISYCRFILNESESGQELQSTLIAGGLVGDNRGLIIYSYIALDDDAQIASDKAFSVNKNVNSQTGTNNLFTGEAKAIGGLVGLNIGSNSKTDDLSGGIKYSYSRVNVQNSSSEIAGGVIGIATHLLPKNLNNIENVNINYDILDNVLSNGDSLYQSAFLYGVYTTGQVMANKYAGGLVGLSTAVINIIKAPETEKGHIAVFPGSVEISDSLNGKLGYVIGKANYSSSNIHFVQIGGQKASQAVSTINLNSSTALVGGVENSALYDGQFKNDLEYDSLASFVWIDQAKETAFSAFGTSDTDVIWDYDKTQEKFIFPKLLVGNVKEVNVIKTVEDYLTYVKSDIRGKYSIQCDYDGSGNIVPIVFDFTSDELIEIDGTSKTLYDWFDYLYKYDGPSGVMVGYTQKGDNALIEIKTNSESLIPFFGASVNSLSLSNIDFVINSESSILSKTAEAGNFDSNLYWGMLMSKARSSIFENISVSFENVQFELSNFKAVGGIVGSSEKSIYNDVKVFDIIVENNNYKIRDDSTKSLIVGGLVGQSSSDTILNSKLTDAQINLNITQNDADSTISVGGVIGYAYGNYFKISETEASSDIELNSTNSPKTVYAGGVVGYVNCSGQKSVINSINSVSSLKILSSSETAYVGGAVGYSNVATISDVSVGGNKSIVVKNAQTAYVGGIVGSYNTTINNIRNAPYIKLGSDLNGNIANINITTENIVSNSYVGGISGIVNLNAKAPIPSVENFVNIIQNNETNGEIVVRSQALANQTTYVGGLFGGIYTLLNGTKTQNENKLALSNSQNIANIGVYDVKQAYIGGICGYSDINISNAINYGVLLNDYSGVQTADCLSYIGGIVAQTSQSLKYCLSLGAIFEPNFVEYQYIDTQSGTTETIQNSFVGALVAKAKSNAISNSYYSSDFTGVLQDDYSSSLNILASDLTKTMFSNFVQAYVDDENGILILPRIAGFSEKSVEFKTLFEIDELESFDKFATYILSEDAFIFNTLTLSDKTNLQIIGMGHTITTNGCALFDVVPKTVMISGIQVLSSKDILAESDFGLLANENFGIITNCIAGQLPQYENNIVLNADEQAIQTLGKDLPNKQFGESDSNILTIYVNNSNINVGALVGINNKTINNCWSYADIKLDNYKKISAFDSGLTYYEKEYYPAYCEYSEVEATSENYMNYYIFDGSYVKSAEFDDSLTYYEKTYFASYYRYTAVTATSENFENFYVLNTVQNSSVGGLVGKNEFKLSYVYSMGKLDVLTSETSKIGGVVGENKYSSTNYVKGLISYVDVYSKNLSVGRVVYNSSNNQMLHIYDLSRTTDKFVAGSGVNVWSTQQAFNNEQIFGSDFFKRDNSYNYGYYYLALENQKSLTANNKIYYIENFVELNMLNKINNNYVSYVFVRDLNAKTPLSVDDNNLRNSSFTINGNGYYVFSDVLLNYDNNYSLFNFRLAKNNKLENILYKFGNTQINSSANSLIVAPLIAEVSGGQISNCAVYGTVEINKSSENPSGIFGGLVGKLTSGEVKFSFSEVNLTISNVNSFVVGGLVGEMGTALLDHCFTAGNIHLKSADNLVYVGGLVGKLNKGDATIIYCYFAGKNEFGLTSIRTDVYNNVYLGEFVGCFDGRLNSSTKEFLKYCLFEGFFVEDERTSCGFIVENGHINKLEFGDDEISSLIAFGYVNGIDGNNINLQNNYVSLANTYGIDSSNYFITQIVDKTTLTTNGFARVITDEDISWNEYHFAEDGTQNEFPYLKCFFDI